MSVVTRASAPREQVDKGKEPDKVIVESVTVWEGRRHRSLSRRDQHHGLSIDAAGASDNSPIWVEMSLKCPAERWVDPWDPPPDPVDWSDFEGVAQGLGFKAPVDDDSLPRDLVAAVLQRLPCINELGELRSLERLLRKLGESAVAVPLVGLRPTSTLGD